ncbi:hypothetical protein LOC67_27020 [Stieleria sp. JC731]|uniref:hypothetical protein n=1 Tax=Stieleria sp. JC731 TaxID=2894195 RepID=UPI001E45955B|nr:hypothetical protein [Stieleria sp. JC731]MCC9602237.1 hypothetical protein [Stieleria sp. JC731]MCC9604222.1 hypothetical protein [Stieleria sp. JC731]
MTHHFETPDSVTSVHVMVRVVRTTTVCNTSLLTSLPDRNGQGERALIFQPAGRAFDQQSPSRDQTVTSEAIIRKLWFPEIQWATHSNNDQTVTSNAIDWKLMSQEINWAVFTSNYQTTNSVAAIG